MNECQSDISAETKADYTPGTAIFTTAATVATGYATSAFGAVSSVIGFLPQIHAGSCAANLMSISATTGYGGAAISAMQSSGALFVNAVGSSTLVAVGAIAAPVVAGYAAYKTYNWYYGEGGEKFADWIKGNVDYYVTPYVIMGGEYCFKAYDLLCEYGSVEKLAECGEYLKESVNYYILSSFRNAEKS